SLDSRGEKLHREHGLPAAGRSRDQRGAVLRQSALRDDVEARNAGGEFFYRRMPRRHLHHVSPEFRLGCTSRPRSTLSLSDRSPITRRNGGGSCLIKVGVARIRSFSATSGCSRTSMISSLYCPWSSFSQIRRRLAMATSARGLEPVTY